MRRGPTGADSRTLSVATGNYVAGRSAGYENQALRLIASYNEGKLLQFSNFHRFAAIAACNPPDIKCINAFIEKEKFYCGRNTEN